MGKYWLMRSQSHLAIANSPIFPGLKFLIKVL